MNEVAIAFGALVYLGLAFFIWRGDARIQELEFEVEALEEELKLYRGVLKPEIMQEIWDLSAEPLDVLAEQRRIREESRANGFRWD